MPHANNEKQETTRLREGDEQINIKSEHSEKKKLQKLGNIGSGQHQTR